MRPIVAIILAAGASTRLGQLKQLLPLGGETVLGRVVRAAVESKVNEVIIVLGYRAEEIRTALEAANLMTAKVKIVVNSDWTQGQSTSLRAGLTAASGAQVAIFLLSDQPLISAELIDLLLERYRQSGKAIVVPIYKGKRGNPVLFDCSLFGELGQLTGDEGGRRVISRHSAEVEWVEAPSKAVLIDIDTWSDYEAMQAEEVGEDA
ncbi:MAG: molybdenum cofactor cytidylyltransferase [Chloroflexi bacterium]|nr:molybdenum cofactor cytidylyltransferase [Chloroflexota bacterium]MCL5074112.1 molybdenum cofactor cytidylyltransferase [Chloroflexota bacterium]